MEAAPAHPDTACDTLAEAREALNRLTGTIDRAMQAPSPEMSDAVIYAARVVHEMERTLAAHEVKAAAFTEAMKAHGDLRYEQGRAEGEAAREEEPALLQLVSGDSPRMRVPRQGVHRICLMSALPAAAAIVAAVAAGPAHHAHFAARTAHAGTAAAPDYDAYFSLRS